MTDSADISDAAKRLQLALSKLEGKLDPILSKVARLEAQTQEASVFTQDRARLASELDEAKSKNEQFATRIETAAAREIEFAQLAEVTTQEIERVINDVERALGRAGSAQN